jgi:hypothetical protein
MSHWCRICGITKSNEKFSGKGHGTHVCKSCQALAKGERDAIEQRDEIFGYLKQSHISPKNVARLRQLSLSQNNRTAELAQVALDVALVRPFKRRRLKFLAAANPELMARLEDTGLVHAQGW